MAATTHLKSLQALEMATRVGSLKSAAECLGITPAAVGQRIRAIELYLGTDLLLRGRSGLQPTAALEQALPDLRQAFLALERVTQTLDFQRIQEIHIVADPDWAELWLAPRIDAFQQANPSILFCINGAGDVPLRLGVPDFRITYGPEPGEPILRDVFLPMTGPDNTRRIANLDPVLKMDGMPLLHIKEQRDGVIYPGWVEWFEKFGHRQSGRDRGVHYPNTRLALQAARQDVGFLVCGLSLILQDLEAGAVVLPFPISQHIPAPHPYRMKIRSGAESRPQIQRFADWLRRAARDTDTQIQMMFG